MVAFTMIWVLLALSASSSEASVQITSWGVRGREGSSLQMPLKEGQNYEMVCEVRVDHGDSYDTCTVTHVLNPEYHDLEEDGRPGDNYGGPYGRPRDNYGNNNNYGNNRGNSNFGNNNNYGGSYGNRGSNSGGYSGRSNVYRNNYDTNNARWNDYDSAPVLKCSVSVDEGSTQCNNVAGSDELDSYASRIRMEATPDSCIVSISGAHKWDNGEWVCHISHTVGINERSSSLTSSADVFVRADPLFTLFTEPDQRVEPYAAIDYVISDPEYGRRGYDDEIRAECSAFGGVPRPELVWAVDDVLNVIRNPRPVPVGSDEHVVAERLVFAPTIDQLCDEYNVGANVCTDRPGDRDLDDLNPFAFNLLCFPRPVDGQRPRFDYVARITVNVSGGASGLTSLSLFSLLLATVANLL